MTTSDITLKCLICRENRPDPLEKEDEIIKRQLSVIYVVNKLLEIPSEVCANFLANFGNPEEWMAICADCSSLVDEGRRLFDQIQELEQRHKKIGQEIRLKMNVKPNADEIDEGQVNFGTAAHEIRNYLDILDNYPVTVIDEEPKSVIFDNLETGELDGNEELSKINWLQSEIKLDKDPLENCPENVIIPNFKSDSDNKRKIEHISKHVDIQLRPSPKKACKMVDDEEEVELKIEQNDKEQKDPLGESFNDYDEDSSADSSKDEIDSVKSKRRKLSTKKVYKKKGKVAPSKSNSKTLKSKPEKLSKSAEPPNGGKCEECGDQYYTCMSLEIHMREKHLEPEAFLCSGCSVSYRMISSYNDHALIMGTVDPSSPCALNAFLCTSRACRGRRSGSVLRSSQSAMDLHQKTHHANELPFRCIPCQLMFQNNHELALHLESDEHRDKLKFHCPVPGCLRAYALHTSWQRHIWERHETYSKHLTTDTASIVQNQGGLDKLESSQIDVDNQEDLDANKSRSGSKPVIKNEIRQQNESFALKNCSKCGVEKSDHTSDSKEQELNCKSCSMTPSQRAEFKMEIADSYHKAIRKRYHCKVCGKPHSRKEDLYSHMRTDHASTRF